jgi:hypothetical protein
VRPLFEASQGMYMLRADGLASKFGRTPYEKIERAVPEGHERCSGARFPALLRDQKRPRGRGGAPETEGRRAKPAFNYIAISLLGIATLHPTWLTLFAQNG